MLLITGLREIKILYLSIGIIIYRKRAEDYFWVFFNQDSRYP